MNYEIYAKFYDATQGDRRKNINQIKAFLHRYRPEAKTILELACGTGSILKGLVDEYEVSGLDNSPQMLEIAKKKVPAARLYEGDMSTFQLGKKYDAILCVYDSVNHLETFTAWEQLFRHAADHLNDTGLLIFDVNTATRLKKLANESPFTQEFEGKKMVMDIVEENENLFSWNIEITDEYGKSYGEVIKEAAYSLPKIESALSRHFELVGVFNNEGTKTDQDVGRLWFICGKKN